MPTYDLNEMPLAELKKLHKDVTKAIDSYEDRQKAEARATLEAKAREMGFSLSDLLDPSKSSGRKANPPKYRHPENADATWSGRGRQPHWIKDILAEGKSLDDFLIS